MKLKFKKQQFQIDAVNAAAELFKGQTGAPSIFSVERLDLHDHAQGVFQGYGNALTIDRAQIQANMNAVQEMNLLPLTEIPDVDGQPEYRFNIEMETGTGKTFVYIKTIFELNKLYGFNKFVVLAPSVAIREGVYHSFKIMESHFAQEYDGRRAHYFIYNSKKLNEVRDFALSSTLEVMIVTIDAINKDSNLFVKESDRMDKTAREFMTECRPIVILDEPQSLDTTTLARTAIKNNLNPLCELRYSATHKEKINTIYRLTPVDAYEKKIVKQICIASDSVAGGFNKPYIRLVEVGKKGSFYAKLELDIRNPKTGLVWRKTVTVSSNAKLSEVTGRDIYDGYEIEGIDCTQGFEGIEFSNTETLSSGKTIGGVDETVMKREQIKSTILIHLEKELRYISRGIKVLSLFFIDEVAKYRIHGADGDDAKGIYAKMFEEEYARLIALPKFAPIRERFPQDVTDVHNGYFSKDKKGALKDTRGDTVDDFDTYSLIMQQKEVLLSFESPLRFIFSHSALREGWDNPNVFQICTLIENRTPFTCRQKIGRGLRLCVNQNGERIEEDSINILHVISNEGFSEFAAKLQTEIEELGVKFGVLDIGMFVNISYNDNNGAADDATSSGAEAAEHKKINHAEATEILQHFRAKNYIDTSGKVKDTLKNALKTGTVDLPARFEAARERIIPILLAADKKVEIKPYKKQVSVKRKDDIFLSPQFTEIWGKMKQKTIFRMAMDITALHEKCAERIKAMEEIKPIRIRKEEARLDVAKAGVSFEETRQRFADAEQEFLLPDITATVAAACRMPRKEVGEILLAADRFADFVNNPQSFAEAVIKIINSTKIDVMMEDGIKYTRLDGQEYTWYEVFNFADEKEALAFLDHNAIAVEHSVYDHVIFDSGVESDFARALDIDNDVKLFFKIPTRFKISTPIGNYSPDWAVYYETADGEKKLYFIIETKGIKDEQGLTGIVNFKNRCGAAHFKAIDTGIRYSVETVWRGLDKE
ncbi:MAG: DEAD/DEAH box helicase family protein [Clostridiales bacterium]|jgi:type III restriction enzyme|nr:DEAD/DEAH box helicase family protein [Clostridiales bacterium]